MDRYFQLHHPTNPIRNSGTFGKTPPFFFEGKNIQATPNSKQRVHIRGLTRERERERAQVIKQTATESAQQNQLLCYFCLFRQHINLISWVTGTKTEKTSIMSYVSTNYRLNIECFCSIIYCLLQLIFCILTSKFCSVWKLPSVPQTSYHWPTRPSLMLMIFRMMSSRFP